MIHRLLQQQLLNSATWAPAIVIVGPRQAGKTKLARTTFPRHTYINLEESGHRDFALHDPQGFLTAMNADYGVILDELHHAPALLPYIKTIIDKEGKLGYFILISSQSSSIITSIPTVFAGQAVLHTLLPLSIAELASAESLSETMDVALFSGGYPRLFNTPKVSQHWYTDHVITDIEHDVHHSNRISDLSAFHVFLQLCAQHIGQSLNISILATEANISQHTAHAWLLALEASYIVFLLEPYHKTFNKRTAKRPKLYFYDTGLACALLHITSAEHLRKHYLRDILFASYIIADLKKQYYNRAQQPVLYFWKDQQVEIDCIVEHTSAITPIEIKTDRTLSRLFFEEIHYLTHIAQKVLSKGYIFYAGEKEQFCPHATILGWQQAGELINLIG